MVELNENLNCTYLVEKAGDGGECSVKENVSELSLSALFGKLHIFPPTNTTHVLLILMLREEGGLAGCISSTR